MGGMGVKKRFEMSKLWLKRQLNRLLYDLLIPPLPLNRIYGKNNERKSVYTYVFHNLSRVAKLVFHEPCVSFAFNMHCESYLRAFVDELPSDVLWARFTDIYAIDWLSMHCEL